MPYKNDATPDASAEKEAEARRIEEMKLTIEITIRRLTRLADIGATERCEAAISQVAALLKSPSLPRPFCNQCQDEMKALMQHTFMKATDLAAKAAIEAAKEDDTGARDRQVKRARENLAGAMRFNAPREFRRKCELLLETAMLTGGVKAKGPTTAKPQDAVPEPESLADA